MATDNIREIKIEGVLYFRLNENESFEDGMKRMEKVFSDNGIACLDSNDYTEQEC